MKTKNYSNHSTKYFKIGYLYLVLLLLTNITSVFGQAILQHQLEYADSLLEKENYFDAITEYKRLQFFDSNKNYEFTTNYKIALCYKAGAKFEESIKYFSLAAISSKNKIDLLESKFQIVRCNILRKTNRNALSILNSYENDSLFTQSLEKINYWRGWAYMFSDDFEKAEYYFDKVSFGKELGNLLINAEKEKYSVNFAKGISYILPGAGQFYTGNYFSGFLSLGWNVLWGYLTVNAIVNNRVFDGIAVGSLLWLRFYRGNFQNAAKFASIKNREITNRVLIQIQNNYRGIKP